MILTDYARASGQKPNGQALCPVPPAKATKTGVKVELGAA